MVNGLPEHTFPDRQFLGFRFLAPLIGRGALWLSVAVLLPTAFLYARGYAIANRANGEEFVAVKNHFLAGLLGLALGTTASFAVLLA